MDQIIRNSRNLTKHLMTTFGTWQFLIMNATDTRHILVGNKKRYWGSIFGPSLNRLLTTDKIELHEYLLLTIFARKFEYCESYPSMSFNLSGDKLTFWSWGPHNAPFVFFWFFLFSVRLHRLIWGVGAGLAWPSCPLKMKETPSWATSFRGSRLEYHAVYVIVSYLLCTSW